MRNSHGEMKIYAKNERERENINPSSPVRFEIFFADVFKMFGSRNSNLFSICPLSTRPVSLYQHLVFGEAGKQVSFINRGFPVLPLLVLLA